MFREHTGDSKERHRGVLVGVRQYAEIREPAVPLLLPVNRPGRPLQCPAGGYVNVGVNQHKPDPVALGL